MPFESRLFLPTAITDIGRRTGLSASESTPKNKSLVLCAPWHVFGYSIECRLGCGALVTLGGAEIIKLQDCNDE